MCCAQLPFIAIAVAFVLVVTALVSCATCVNRQHASKARAVWPDARACLHASVPGPHAWTSLLKQCMRERARLAGSLALTAHSPSTGQYADGQGELSGAVLL